MLPSVRAVGEARGAAFHLELYTQARVRALMTTEALPTGLFGLMLSLKERHWQRHQLQVPLVLRPTGKGRQCDCSAYSFATTGFCFALYRTCDFRPVCV